MAQLTVATTTDDLINDYVKGMNTYALSEKYGVSAERVTDLINEKFPEEDVTGMLVNRVKPNTEGENPEPKK
jgi:uncharacterized protein YjcR